MPPKIRIALQGLSGESEQIELDTQHPTTTACLKHRVFDLWHIPPMCQSIVAGARFLDDSEDIGALSAEDNNEPIPLMVVISSDSVQRLFGILQQRSWGRTEQKVEALQAIAQLGTRAGAQVLDAATCHLHDRCAEIRAAALSVVGAVSVKGSGEGIQAAIFAMSDETSIVRQEAARVLSVLAERGNMRAIEAAMTLLPHHDADFMITAMRALLTAVETGDTSCVAQCSAHLKEDEKKERCAALEGMGALVEQGSAPTVALLVQSIDPPLRDMAVKEVVLEGEKERCAALGALGALVEKGNAAVVTLLIRSMDPPVRDLAVKVLVVLANGGDAGAVLSMLACLGGGGELAGTVVEGLAKHVRKGADHLSAAIANCMETADVDVWPVLVEAYSVVTEDDERPMGAIAARLEASEWWIRRAAFLALGALLQRGNSCARMRAFAAVFSGTQDENTSVRQAAFHALEVLQR